MASNFTNSKKTDLGLMGGGNSVTLLNDVEAIKHGAAPLLVEYASLAKPQSAYVEINCHACTVYAGFKQLIRFDLEVDKDQDVYRFNIEPTIKGRALARMLTSKKFQQLVTEFISSFREAKIEEEKATGTDISDLFDKADALADAHSRLSTLIQQVSEDWDNQVIVQRIADFFCAEEILCSELQDYDRKMVVTPKTSNAELSEMASIIRSKAVRQGVHLCEDVEVRLHALRRALSQLGDGTVAYHLRSNL